MKNALLIMSDFYGYYSELIKELNIQGWKISWMQDKVSLNNFERVFSKINKRYTGKKYDKYFNKTLDNLNNKFDLIIIIFGGNFLEEKHINILKQKFKETPIVYYAWDSVKNFPKIKGLFACCDKSFTFDKEDALKYNVEFLPLFYIKKIKSDKKIKYDISTVMSFYVEKGNRLRTMLSSISDDKTKYLYLRVRSRIYSKIIKFKEYKVYKMLNKYFKFKNLSNEETLSIFEESFAVIDCPLPNQKGLTMRTFEVLALNRKLITCNSEISNYDFYTPKNIFIVKNENQKIPNSFFEEPFDESYSLSENYSISSFVKKIIMSVK